MAEPALATPDAALPKITGLDDWNALEPGKPYLDPEGVQRKKPFSLTGKTPDDLKASYAAIPEGEEYATPEGVIRVKPKYEGLDLTTQTLYDMARTPAERRKVLERVGTVKGEGDELYAETPQGKRLKPGAGSQASRATALIASEAAPVGGAVAGEVAGAAAGTAAEPGVGTFVGAMGGGAAGGAAGQAFNDMVLKLAGVHDRSAGEEARDIASAGLASGTGTGTGRVMAAGAPAAREAVGALASAAPRAFAKIAGATPEGVGEAARLAGKGAMVPPSSWLPELPYVHKVVEDFDPAFRRQNPLKQSAEGYYGREAGKVLDDLGIPADQREPLTSATARVSSERAGQMSLDRIRTGLAEEDAKLAATTDAAKKAVAAKYMDETGGAEAHAAAIEQLKAASASNREMAQRAIDEGFTMIRADADAAIKAVGANENPGDMVRQFATKIQTLRAGIKLRAAKLYDAADAAAGVSRPDVSALKSDAAEFLDSLPEPFKAKHPDIVKRISELEPGQTTFGQLHNLRSMIRQDIDYGDLTPSMRDGTLKRFAGKVDEALMAGQTPELKSAAELLDKADAFYAKNMPRFQDEKVRGIVDATKAGMPMDASVLAREVFQPGYTERMTELRKIVGKPLWSAVQAADTKAMIEGSRSLVPGEIDGGAFARQVVDRYQSGVLEAGYDKETAEKLMTQAQRIQAADGKIPVKALPGDTVVSLVRKADEYLAEADKLAKTDPLGSLTGEIKRIEDEGRDAAMRLKQERKGDPLNFMFKANAGPIKSADRILASPDLMVAAARRFGEDSPEFTALRQVYAHRLLQRSSDSIGALKSDMVQITPEVQQLVFPGVSLDNAKQLAKDMEFLVGGPEDPTRMAGSMAGGSRILHPFGALSKSGLTKFLPGSDTLGRLILGKYYSLVTYGTTHPVFINWVAKGLQSGDPAQRATVKAAVQRVLSGSGGASGAIGAGTSEALYQDANTP